MLGQCSRTSFKNNTPVRPGMRWSHKITLTGWRCKSPRASSALLAVNTVKSSSSVRRRASCERTSSSTTSTVGNTSEGTGVDADMDTGLLRKNQRWVARWRGVQAWGSLCTKWCRATW